MKVQLISAIVSLNRRNVVMASTRSSVVTRGIRRGAKLPILKTSHPLTPEPRHPLRR
jgi:hypothetical protein